jgi:hypothetical protein
MAILKIDYDKLVSNNANNVKVYKNNKAINVSLIVSIKENTDIISKSILAFELDMRGVELSIIKEEINNYNLSKPLIVRINADLDDINLDLFMKSVRQDIKIVLDLDSNFSNMKLVYDLSSKYSNLNFCGGYLIKLNGCNVGCLHGIYTNNELVIEGVNGCNCGVTYLEDYDNVEYTNESNSKRVNRVNDVYKPSVVKSLPSLVALKEVSSLDNF